MFMWTYTNGSIAANAFDAPTVEHLVDGVDVYKRQLTGLLATLHNSRQLTAASRHLGLMEHILSLIHI